MNQIESGSNTKTAVTAWSGLYKGGAAAALIAAVLFRRNLDAEWLLLRQIGIIQAGPLAAPDTVADWFMLLRHRPLLGLTFLNLFDLVNYALLGLIFLALAAALYQTSRPGIIIAAGLSCVGISIYFASNQAFNMLLLSRQYSAATTDAQRAVFLSAGQTLLALHHNASYRGTGIYLSFLLVSAAGLILSVIMLRSSVFSKSAGYLGVLANSVGLSYYIALALAPALVFVPLSVSAVFLLIWHLQISSRLWALGTSRPARALRLPASSGRGESQKDHPSLRL